MAWVGNRLGGGGGIRLQELLEKEKNAVTTQQRMTALSLSDTQRERKVRVILKSVDKRLGKVQVRP